MPDQDIDLLTKYNFAESGNQKPSVWVANAYAALNRLNSGNYGKDLNSVINDMSSAIRTNSKQWQLASGQKKRNEYEENVFKKIMQQMYLVKTGKVANPIGTATHFENIEKYGTPYWAKTMTKIAKIGEHTYFSENTNTTNTDFGFGKRRDGTNKGLGYYGKLMGKDTSRFSTEISVGVTIDGKEVQIPTLVPTLSGEEVSYLVNGGKPTKTIIGKAIAHARKRIKEGKSPFAQKGEQQEYLNE